MTSLRAVRLSVLLMLGGFALRCAPDVSVLPCATSDNCPNGFVCVAGQCTQTDGGTMGGGASGGSTGGGTAGGASGGGAGGMSGGSGGGGAGGLGGGSSGGSAGGQGGGASGGLAGGLAGGVAGGSGGGTGGTGGGTGGTGGGIGGSGGGTGGAGGGTGGSGGGGCTRDSDCGSPSGCLWPRCQMLTGVCFQAPVDAGVMCRASAGVCDVEERCDGTTTACPLDGFIAGVQCAAPTGPCDRPAFCNGLGPSCPTRPFVDAGVVCRAAAGGCDVEERCTGTSGTCPNDALAAPGTRCGPDGGGCDLQATCNGTSPVCPPKPLVDAGVICRQDDVCRPPQRCTGISGVCPGPTFPQPDRCDDSNLCSDGVCLTSGCQYSLNEDLTSQALLGNTLDAGVVVVRVPRLMTSTGGFPNVSAEICGVSFPPRCEMQLEFSAFSFGFNVNVNVTGGQVFGSGTVPVLVPHIPIVLDTTFGTFQGGVAYNPGGCGGPTPFVAGPVLLNTSYSFRIDEPDGGVLSGFVPPSNLSNRFANPSFCWESTIDPLVRAQAESALSNLLANHLGLTLEAAFRDHLRSQLCLRPHPISGVCALGSPQSTPAGPICVTGAGNDCYSGHRFRTPSAPTAPACVP